MRLARPTRSRVLTFNLTPMIDVVLQLIIFFMFTSQFGQITQTKVDLPLEPGEKAVVTDPPSFAVDLAADGSLMLDGRTVSRARFLRMVDAEIRRSGGADMVTILVRPDRALAARSLNELALDLRKRGVRRWRIGTTDPNGGAR